MTDTQSALLRAVLADPASDDARLVYADWLDENGQPERAEFIRVQVELARRNPSPVLPSNQEELAALRARERELQSLDNCIAWFTIPGTAISWTASEGIHGWYTSDGHTIRTRLSRGFISSVTCTSDWLQRHAAVFWHPEQTEECPECKGSFIRSVKCGLGHTHRVDCYCENGRIPRPCPATAQPIERVVLTTEPDWEHWNPVFSQTEQAFYDDRWPGIVFEAASCSRSQPIIGEFGVDGHVFL